MKSIGLKIGIIYLLLIIINTSFFTVFVFENQMELIIENAKYKSLDTASKVVASLNSIVKEMEDFSSDYTEETKIIEKLSSLSGSLSYAHLFFTESGRVLYGSSDTLSINEEFIKNSSIAKANKELLGDQFYAVVEKDNNFVDIYIPFSVLHLDNAVLFIRLEMAKIGDFLQNFYFLIIFLIAGIVIVHIILGTIVYSLVIIPIGQLSKKSMQLAGGNYSSRIKIKRKDELGKLGNSFNTMAQAIQDTISSLNDEIKLRKEIAEKLDEQNQVLKRLNALKDDLVSLVSHDLRTPFSSIIGLASIMLRDKETLKDEYVQMLDMIITSSNDLLNMVNKLLDLAALEHGKINIEKKSTSLEKIITDSYNRVIYIFKKKEISFLKDLNPETQLFVDEVWIVEALTNLLSNALKYTNKGGMIKITSELHDENSICLMIEDNGIGISPEVLEYVFDKHKKTSTRGLDGERGSGFGLPLCKQIIELHGGKIRIESQKNKGTKVSFTLPTQST